MGLSKIRTLLSNGARVIFIGDSYATAETLTGTRISDQFFLGVPMADINAYEPGMGYRGNNSVTRHDTTSYLTNRSEGSNWDTVDAAEGNSYSVNGGDGTVHLGLPVTGLTMKWNSDIGTELTSGAGGVLGVVSLRLKGTSILHDTTSGTNNWNVFGLTGNKHKFRPNYYVNATADTYGNASSETLEFRDGTATVRSDNVSLLTGTRGKYWRGDADPATNTRNADVATINAVATDILVEENQTASGQRLVIYDNTGAATAHASDDSINWVGCPIYKVDGSGDWIPGTYYQNASDASWAFGNFATDAASTGNKQFTDDQLYDWLDVTTIDLNQDIIVVTFLAAEAGGAAAIKSDMESIMDRFEGWATSAGAKTPQFLNIAAHRQSGVTDPQAQSNSEGVRLASVGRSNAAFVSLYDLTGGILFNASGAEEDAWIEANLPDPFSFGSVSGVTHTTLKSAALLSDGIHPTANGAAVFTYLLNNAIQSGDDTNTELTPGLGLGMGIG